MSAKAPSLYQKLQEHFNAAAETHPDRPVYPKLFRDILEFNKDRLNPAMGKLTVPFSYMENDFYDVLNEANKIVREHKGPVI